MRFRSIAKWDNPKESKSLLYFAQLVDELLFDYTLDSYKPSAMNTPLLISEAATTIIQCNAKIINKANLKHIFDEICENLPKDEVALSLLAVDINEVRSALNTSTDQSKSAVIDLLQRQLSLTSYKKQCEKLLTQAIINDDESVRIRALTRTYITTLLNDGYSSKFISNIAQDFFFYDTNRISNNAAIEDFISNFSLEDKEHIVIYRAPAHLLEFAEAAERLGINMHTTLPELQDQLNRQHFALRNGEIYFMLDDIEGKEPHSVRIIAENRVATLQTLIGLYHHKNLPTPITECLVGLVNMEDLSKVPRTINPMYKCRDLRANKAATSLTAFIDKFAMQNDSFKRFNRSAELHALALSSSSVENQMINLWIALESLIPPTDGEVAQIEHICESTMPFLNLFYAEKLVISLVKDLIGWNRGYVTRLFRDVNGEGFVDKLVRVLSLPEHKDKREQLSEKMEDFHLLRDRLNRIESMLSSPEALVKTLDTHKIRVQWQLRRIYRARNSIVHDGSTPTYTEILIENLHDYLDSILNTLMNLASHQGTINSVSQGFKMMELNYKAYYQSLKKKGVSFTQENLQDLLFRYAQHSPNSKSARRHIKTSEAS